MCVCVYVCACTFVYTHTYTYVQGIVANTGSWRVSHVNHEYTACDSYPRKVAVPAGIRCEIVFVCVYVCVYIHAHVFVIMYIHLHVFFVTHKNYEYTACAKLPYHAYVCVYIYTHTHTYTYVHAPYIHIHTCIRTPYQ